MKLQQRGFDEFALIVVAAVIFVGILAFYFTSSLDTYPHLQPREIFLVLLPNEKSSFTIKVLANSSNTSLEVEGEVRNLIFLSESSFSVFGEKEISLKVQAPPTLGTYSGYIKARTNAGEDRIPVKIIVSSFYQLASRTITYPSFTISRYGKENIVDAKYNDYVEKSIFSDKKVRLVLSQVNKEEIEEAYVNIIVSDVKGSGELIVKQNNRILFRGKVNIGELKVPLNVSEFGSVNFIILEATNPSWNIFEKTKYEVFEVKIVVEYKENSQTLNLELGRNEIERFYSLEISSLVQSSYPIPILEIKVNDQIVYRDRIPIAAFRLNITRDIIGERLLLKENNKIKFSLVSEGYITFSNNIFKIYYRE